MFVAASARIGAVCLTACCDVAICALLAGAEDRRSKQGFSAVAYGPPSLITRPWASPIAEDWLRLNAHLGHNCLAIHHHS